MTFFRFLSLTIPLCSFGCGSTSSSKGNIDLVTVQWSFEPPARGAIISSPIIHDDAVYICSIEDRGFDSFGTLYRLSLKEGKPIWKFSDEGEMRHSISSPFVSKKRVFIGEGMHANHFCKLYCVDAQSGKRIWAFQAEGHIESSPVVVQDRVVFGAGDDGIHCLDANKGTSLWQVKDTIHVDSNPFVLGDHVYIGSGVSRAFKQPDLRCLRLKDGSVVWRVPIDLPAWGSPVGTEEAIYFGLGNGRLTSSALPPEKPQGALLAVNASTGKTIWRYDLPDAVMKRGTIQGDRIYFGCRDHYLYCLNRMDGTLLWKQSLESPIVTTPFVQRGKVYTIAIGGRIACFDSASGKEIWRFEIGQHTNTKPVLLASPIVVDAPENRGGNWILFGTELKNPVDSAAVMYCLWEKPIRSTNE